MKRDWDVIRKILVALEEKSDKMPLRSGSITGIPANEASYNMGLLIEAGLIVGQSSKALGMGSEGPPALAISLTWSGHELLDAIRAEGTWNHVKATAKERGLDLTLDLVVACAKAYIASKTGLPL